MRNELHHIVEIEKYLLGLLPAEEKILFEARMSASPSLKRDVLLQQQLMERLKTNAFVADARQFHNQFLSNDSSWWKNGFSLNSILLICALGLMAFGGYYISSVNSSGENKPMPAAVSAVQNQAGSVIHNHATPNNPDPAMVEETPCKKSKIPQKSTNVVLLNEEQPEHDTIEPGAEGLEATVITGRNGKEVFAAGDFVYLDADPTPGSPWGTFSG